MTRNLRPALPALALLLGAVGLGVPASSAQSKGTSKKKVAASSAKPASPKAATAKASGKTAPAKGPSTKKAAEASKAASRTGKRTTGRSRKQPGQKAPASDRVIEIQSALAKDGSFSGTPDGKWSDDTASAMRRFQASHGLNPTGRLDARTLQKLGLGSETAGVAAPTPPPGSVSRLTSSAIAPSAPAEAAQR